MQLVPQGKSHIELWAVAIGDGLIRAGQRIHRAFAVVADEPAADELYVRLERWRSHVQAFVAFGDPLAFAQRPMIAAGIVTRPAHDTYMRLLKRAGLIVSYPRSGYAWAWDWDRRKFAALLRRGLITLPYPIDADPPKLFAGPVADAQYAQRTQPAQVSVWTSSGPKPPELKGRL